VSCDRNIQKIAEIKNNSIGRGVEVLLGMPIENPVITIITGFSILFYTLHL